MEPSSSENLKRSSSDEILPEFSAFIKLLKKSVENDKEEENHFLQLKKLMLYNITILKKVAKEDIVSAIPIIKESFPDNFTDINLSDWSYLCAYLFRYGAHGAGLTRSKTLEAFQKCEDFLSVFKKPELNIISLGCGPGLDIIGLSSALCEYDIRSKLNITLIDSINDWNLCTKLINLFIRECNYGQATEIIRNGKLSFFPAKLPVAKKQENIIYFKALRDADVILMTKFISSLEKNCERISVIEEIQREMKDGAYILCIDSTYKADSWDCCEELYFSGIGDEYRYESSATEQKYNSDDAVSSKSGVIVLRKKAKK